MGEDNSTSDVPWASVFDPAANARALSAIQAEGFRAASKLVDRFVGQAADGIAHGANGSDPGTAPRTPAVASVNGNGGPHSNDFNLEQLVKTWWLIAGQFLLGSARVAASPFIGSASHGGPASLDLGDTGGEGILELHAETSGRATAEIWLHNRGPDDLGEVTLRCSDLLAYDGDVVEAAAMHFEPKIVPMPGRSSRGVAVSIVLAPRVR